MIDVLFFARLREQLGTDRLCVEVSPGTTVVQLRDQLIAEHGAGWSQALGADNIIKAVNQDVVGEDYVLEDGDEVAFFPPVTGG